MTRVPSGIHGLDGLIGGGLPAERATLVTGDAGAGKTAFALHFLMEGVRRGEAGLLISAEATRPPISHRVWIALEASPLFTHLQGRRSDDARQLASDLARSVRHLGAKRVVIDDAPSLVGHGVEDGGVEDLIRSLLASLDDNLGSTLLLTARSSPGRQTSTAVGVLERLASGVIALSGGQTDRWVQVRKMRGTAANLDPYFVGGLSAPRSLSASDPKPSACDTFSRAV